MPLSTGQTINNRYRIVKLLGQGGFGAVYRAWDMNVKAPCAVKENFDTSPEAVRQFEQEAVILANLRHASLPRVSDHFVVAGQGQVGLPAGEGPQDAFSGVHSAFSLWRECWTGCLPASTNRRPTIWHQTRTRPMKRPRTASIPSAVTRIKPTAMYCQ